MSEQAYGKLVERALRDRRWEARALRAYRAGAPVAGWSWACRCGEPFSPVEAAKWRGDSWHWRHALAGHWKACKTCGRSYALVGGGQLGAPGLLELPHEGTRAYRGRGATPLIECTYAESVALSALEELRATYDHKLQDLEESALALRKLEAAGVDPRALDPLRARSLSGVQLLEAQRALKAKVRAQKRQVLARIVGARGVKVPSFDRLEWWRDRQIVQGAKGPAWKHGLAFVAISPLPRAGEHVQLEGYTPLPAVREGQEPEQLLDVGEVFPELLRACPTDSSSEALAAASRSPTGSANPARALPSGLSS